VNAQEWKEKSRKKAEETSEALILPSGMEIRARRPSLDQILSWGRLPYGLLRRDGGSRQVSDDDVVAMAQSSQNILLACVVSPRVSLNAAGDDEIHPRDICDEDLKFILRWAMRVREEEQLRPFRGERQSAAVGGDSEAVRPEAIGDGGDRRPGDRAGSGPGGGAGDRGGNPVFVG